MVILYRVASNRSYEGLQLFWGRVSQLSQEKSIYLLIPDDLLISETIEFHEKFKKNKLSFYLLYKNVVMLE